MKNKNFILQPVESILEEMQLSTARLSADFNTLPVYNYILQAVLLKMTGFMEQKMKLIFWEMATNSPEIRLKLFKNNQNEFSSYKDKKGVFTSLYKEVKRKMGENKIKLNYSQHVKDTKELISQLFEESLIKDFSARDFFFWQEFITELSKKEYIPSDSNFLPNHVQNIYERTIRFRHTIAHNTKAPLVITAELKSLQEKEYKYENYFVRFSVIILVDKIFIELFKQYLEYYEE